MRFESRSSSTDQIDVHRPNNSHHLRLRRNTSTAPGYRVHPRMVMICVVHVVASSRLTALVRLCTSRRGPSTRKGATESDHCSFPNSQRGTVPPTEEDARARGETSARVWCCGRSTCAADDDAARWLAATFLFDVHRCTSLRESIASVMSVGMESIAARMLRTLYNRSDHRLTRDCNCPLSSPAHPPAIRTCNYYEFVAPHRVTEYTHTPIFCLIGPRTQCWSFDRRRAARRDDV
jgi:hypothetical protein